MTHSSVMAGASFLPKRLGDPVLLAGAFCRKILKVSLDNP
jgi:hypothetical protein